MTKPCGCPEERFPGLGDDDRFAKVMKSSLIEAMTPVDFTITIKVKAAGNLDTIDSILQEFQSYKNDPYSDKNVDELTQELEEIIKRLDTVRQDTTDIIHDALADSTDYLLDIDVNIHVK
jgi:C4-type Zn-finger protein